MALKYSFDAYSKLNEEVAIDERFLTSFLPGGYSIKKIQGSRVEVQYQATDRVKARDDIVRRLANKSVKYTDGVAASTSIEGFKTIDISHNNIVYRVYIKPAKQSGAGAETTALGESFQAYASAARQAKGTDLTSPDDIFEINPTTGVNADRTLKQCQSLPANWQYSGYKIANALQKFLGRGQYTFHRGGDFIKRLEDEFNYHKKNENLPIRDINKWTPADIWAVKNGFTLPRNHFTSITEYNQFLYEAYKSKKLVGVSLKVLAPGSEPKQEIYNDTDVLLKTTVTGFNTTLNSKDAYVVFQSGQKQGKMQLRTFTAGMTSWQGEIKGAAAAGGKVSGGPLEEMLKGVAPQLKFVTVQQAKTRVKQVTPALVQEFLTYYNNISATKVKREDIEKMLKDNNESWRYSKYLSLQYCYILNTLPKKKSDELISDIIGYASSSTKYSAVFVKYS